MPALSSIFIELGINTAAFADGVNKATYQAKAGAQQISSSLQGIGTVVGDIGSKFGEFGGIVGEAMGAAGQSIAKLVHSMGDMSGMMGTMKVGALGLAAFGAAAATAGGAVVAMAIHASEGAKRLYELSESTGVNVQTLSGLGSVAKLVGLDVDSLGKGLERLSKSALAAATAAPGATNGYTMLNISVRNADGTLKNTSDLFLEVAGKFSTMKDGAEKTALAMQIFGRAGAQLIPLLNQGKDGLKYWVDYATQVGAVLDEKAAKGATAFQEELMKLQMISEGVQNKLMVALLPALDHITQAITVLVSKGNAIQQFGDLTAKVLVWLAERVVDVMSTFQEWSANWNIFSAQFQKVMNDLVYAWEWTQSKITGKPLTLDLTKMNEQLDAQIGKYEFALLKIQATAAEMKKKLESIEIEPSVPEMKQTQEAPIPPQKTGMGSVKVPTDTVMQYIRTLEQEVATQQELAKSVAGTTAAIDAQEAKMAAENEVFKLGQQLTEKQKALTEQLKQAKAESGQAAVAHAQQLQVELRVVNQEITELATNKDHIIALMQAKKQAASETAFEKSLVAEHEKIQAEIAGLKAEAAAVFQTAAAKRDAAAQAAAATTMAKSPFAPGSPEYKAAYAEALADERALQAAKYQTQVAQEAENLATTKGYTDRIQLIKDAMAAYSNDRDIQLAGNMAIQQEMDKVAKAWDANALAMGNFGEKATAVLNELAMNAQNTGAQIAKSFQTAFDGIGKNIADMVTTGKSNFMSLFQTLEQQIMTALMNKALDDLINKVMGLFSMGPTIGQIGTQGGLAGAAGGMSIAGGLSDMGGGGGMTNTGGGIGGLFTSLLSFLIPHAGGGDVAPGVGYLVGERGPEAFIPSQSGTIIPNSTIAGSRMTQNVQVHVHGATDPDTFRKASPQIAASIFSNMRMAAARNGGGM